MTQSLETFSCEAVTTSWSKRGSIMSCVQRTQGRVTLASSACGCSGRSWTLPRADLLPEGTRIVWGHAWSRAILATRLDGGPSLSLHLPSFDGFPLVVLFLPFRQAQGHFDAPVLVVEAEGHQRHALFDRLA